MEKLCPLLKEPCIEHQCKWYTEILGTSPQTGEVMHKWGCAVEWLPVLLLENAKHIRHAGAETETLRKDIHSGAAGMVMRALASASKEAGQLEKKDEDRS